VWPGVDLAFDGKDRIDPPLTASTHTGLIYGTLMAGKRFISLANQMTLFFEAGGFLGA
jgi:hypothetical protein